MNREEAIEVYHGLINTKIKEAFEFFAPELREINEEEIRKDIIGGLMWQRDNLKSEGPHDNNLILPGFCLTVGEHLSYLEKQKDLDKMIVVSPDVWDNAITDAYENGKKDGEKQKEQKPAEKPSMLELLREHLVNTPKEQLDAEFEELKEFTIPKPMEWSEEDEDVRDNIICILQKDITYTPPTRPNSCTVSGNAFYTHQTEIDWLKSIRPQPQQNMSIGFMLYLDEHRPDGKMCLSNAECNEIETAFKNQSWDTILRYVEKYQPHWKPSEEQLNSLNFAITYFMHETNYKNPTELRDLYDDLLKLKQP